MSHYDLIIIGGGPAGLTAAIYARRKELKVLMIAKSVGGQAAIAHEVQNWPGTESIDGFQLAQNWQNHAKAWELEIISDEVSALAKNAEQFTVKTSTNEFTADAVILSFGLTPRDLGVPGEKALIGKGVSYCATCDGPLFKGKNVAIVGGGNSALEAVEYLSHLANKIYLLSDVCKSNADATALDKLKQHDNVEITCGIKVQEVMGDSRVTGIKFADVETNEVKEIAVDGIFVEIGYLPKTGWLKGTVDLNERGEIKTDKLANTSLEGVFAAGDCADTGYKQMIIAAGEGAKSALSAYKYIASKRGLIAKPDWGKK